MSVVCVLCLIYKFRISYQVVALLKNLFYNLHQNFLLVINLILFRIPASTQNNIWVVKLNTLVINKQIKTIEGEDLFLLSQSNQIISNIIKNLIKYLFNNDTALISKEIMIRTSYYVSRTSNKILINTHTNMSRVLFIT
jgi:hypothetical protein